VSQTPVRQRKIDLVTLRRLYRSVFAFDMQVIGNCVDEVMLCGDSLLSPVGSVQTADLELPYPVAVMANYLHSKDSLRGRLVLHGGRMPHQHKAGGCCPLE
jgi:hypothetical protein